MGVYIVTKTITDGSKRYHVRWGNGRGVRVVHLGSFKEKKLAEERKKFAEAQLVMDRAPSRELLDQRQRQDQGLFPAVADAWLASEHKSDSAMRGRAVHVRKMSARWRTKQPRAITRPVVQAFIDDLAADEKMGSTISGYLVTLRAILRVGAGIDVNAWWGDLNVPSDDYVPLDLPNAERRAVRDSILYGRGRHGAPSPARRAIFDVLEHGGLRIGEAMALTWGQVDNANDRLLQIGTKGIKKGGKKKPRTVARLDFQPDWIPQRPEGVADSDRVWPLEHLTGRSFRDALANACGKAGVEPYTPHDLRHLHATRLNRWATGAAAKHDLSLKLMADRLGHRQEEFLDLYSDHDMPID